MKTTPEVMLGSQPLNGQCSRRIGKYQHNSFASSMLDLACSSTGTLCIALKPIWVFEIVFSRKRGMLLAVEL